MVKEQLAILVSIVSMVVVQWWALIVDVRAWSAPEMYGHHLTFPFSMSLAILGVGAVFSVIALAWRDSAAPFLFLPVLLCLVLGGAYVVDAVLIPWTDVYSDAAWTLGASSVPTWLAWLVLRSSNQTRTSYRDLVDEL